MALDYRSWSSKLIRAKDAADDAPHNASGNACANPRRKTVHDGILLATAIGEHRDIVSRGRRFVKRSPEAGYGSRTSARVRKVNDTPACSRQPPALSQETPRWLLLPPGLGKERYPRQEPDEATRPETRWR